MQCNAQTDANVATWLQTVGGAGVAAGVQCNNKTVTWTNDFEQKRQSLYSGRLRLDLATHPATSSPLTFLHFPPPPPPFSP